jgi:hypothetical protein
VTAWFRLLPCGTWTAVAQQTKQPSRCIEAFAMHALTRLQPFAVRRKSAMSPSKSHSRMQVAVVSAPAADGLQREAQAQLALNELFPHLRVASDAALRDIFVSLRVPSRPQSNA